MRHQRGEFVTANLLSRGQPFERRFALPPALAAQAGGLDGVSAYASTSELRAIIDRERPDAVVLASGYLFALNATEAATLQTFIGSLGAANIRVGIAASASDATGGNETFFIFNSGAVSATPEPSTVALMATGLFGLAGVARRRRRS